MGLRERGGGEGRGGTWLKLRHFSRQRFPSEILLVKYETTVRRGPDEMADNDYTPSQATLCGAHIRLCNMKHSQGAI